MSQLVIGTEFLASGTATRREFDRTHRKIHRNVYAPRDMQLTAGDRAQAAWLWSDRTAVASGYSAAALHGSRWIPQDAPAELVGTQYPAPAGIVVHQDEVADDEIVTASGVPCTSVARTGFDLGRRLPFTEGLAQVDALLNATGAPMSAIAGVAARYPGSRNIRRLRDLLTIADGGAESPLESRARLILIRGGLPRPETQIPVGWRRVDMGWRKWRVGVEYDGRQHWDSQKQYEADIARLEYLAAMGWRIVRVVAEHLRNPGLIVERAEQALRAAGWQGVLTPSRIGLLTPRPARMR